ncbi:hypothetical protein L3Y34_017846 [Caenorhabditis briggsae]|uniref:Cyclin-dependent kinase inhibitor domain-containing protein n=1 Tax=Caenorhabditis briggsae TaxID=6238 RepID=A0AAE9IUB6_CAEBR|nr:hypothetical protein L3Y34_017846 [Caenorhabditis briggsae]
MATSTGDSKRKAARCLFGRPNPGEVSKKLDASLERMYAEESRKWNFDFAGGVPLVGAQGDYEYESVAASEVPSFYRETTVRPRKHARHEHSPAASDTVEIPEEALFVVEQNEPQHSIASTSQGPTDYEKPVTRASVANKTHDHQDADSLKQTKLTNYMPVRKRRSETCLVTAAVSMNRSVSMDSTAAPQKEKRGSKHGNNNKGAPKRPLRFVPPNLPKPAQSSISDSVLVSSPRSPPAKKSAKTSRRAGRFNDSCSIVLVLIIMCMTANILPPLHP